MTTESSPAPLFPPFQNIFRLLDSFAFFYIVFIISID